MTNIAVLISGFGSNLQALIDAQKAGQLGHGTIRCVISNKADAFGLQRAEQAGIATEVIPAVKGEPRETYDEKLLACLQSHNIELVVLAGFMRILTPVVIAPFDGRMINIHPSLLPKYKGLHTHEQVIKNGDTEHGCSVHFVTEDLDGGPIIQQLSLTVSPEDTAASLKERVHQLEHQLLPAVVAELCS